MSGPNSAYPETLPPDQGRLVDQICDRFENAWKTGGRPRIEEFLHETPLPLRSVVLHELLALEVEYRRRQGETPAPEEYRPRFKEHAGLVDTVFGEPPRPAAPAPSPRLFAQCTLNRLVRQVRRLGLAGDKNDRILPRLLAQLVQTASHQIGSSCNRRFAGGLRR
jgi:hypothetical protein